MQLRWFYIPPLLTEEMNTLFKRHQAVRLVRSPNPEYIEYHNEDDPDFQETPLIKGMTGRINMLLPNGQYHVEILDKNGKILAYVACNEEDLEAVKE